MFTDYLQRCLTSGPQSHRAPLSPRRVLSAAATRCAIRSSPTFTIACTKRSCTCRTSHSETKRFRPASVAFTAVSIALQHFVASCKHECKLTAYSCVSAVIQQHFMRAQLDAAKSDAFIHASHKCESLIDKAMLEGKNMRRQNFLEQCQQITGKSDICLSPHQLYKSIITKNNLGYL